MRLKNCPCCKRPQTTKNSKFIGRQEGMLWFNCLSCNSTFVIGAKNRKQRKSKTEGVPLMKAVSCAISIVCLIGCSEGEKQEPIQYYRTASVQGAPFIQKHGLVFPNRPLPESSPVVFNGELLIVSAIEVGHGTYLKVYRESDEAELTSFPINIGFISAFVHNNRLYAFGSNAWGGGRGTNIQVVYTDDLTTWSSPQVIYSSPEGEFVFNNSVTQTPDGFVMAFETCRPGEICYQAQFLKSYDLINWFKIDGRAEKGYYTACPTIRYFNGYYYMMVLSSFKTYWATTIMRSTDLTNWENSQQTVVAPTDGLDVNKNTSDIDYIEYGGQVYIVYSPSSQTPQWVDPTQRGLRKATYNGTLQELMERFFQ